MGSQGDAAMPRSKELGRATARLADGRGGHDPAGPAAHQSGHGPGADPGADAAEDGARKVRLDRDENILKAVRFDSPDYIPVEVRINKACWHHYPQDALQDLMAQHPLLFPGFERQDRVVPQYAPHQIAGRPFTDPWGCVWETTDDGITGTVTEHPLADWSAFESHRMPDPGKTKGRVELDWDRCAEEARGALDRGELARGGLEHGHTFQLLADLRGYENLIFDMADDSPDLRRLIEVVEAFNLSLIDRYLDIGVNWVFYPEDLGMQIGPMVSPDHFREYIKPSYERLMKPARERGCIVHVHCDGDIRDLARDLVDAGVEVLNLQDLVNGLDWIGNNLTGRVCIDLDIDRQKITRFGTPAQIDALVREEVEKLGSRDGGLILGHGLYPGLPLENVKALMDAMEKYAGHYA
jgi:uroporphyrinogen decarboxylase